MRIIFWCIVEFLKVPNSSLSYLISPPTTVLAMMCDSFCRDGNNIVVIEEPTYFLAKHVFESSGVKMVPIEVDEHGMKVESLRDKLQKGLRPSFVYTIPTYHN